MEVGKILSYNVVMKLVEGTDERVTISFDSFCVCFTFLVFDDAIDRSIINFGFDSGFTPPKRFPQNFRLIFSPSGSPFSPDLPPSSFALSNNA